VEEKGESRMTKGPGERKDGAPMGFLRLEKNADGLATFGLPPRRKKGSTREKERRMGGKPGPRPSPLRYYESFNLFH